MDAFSSHFNSSWLNNLVVSPNQTTVGQFLTNSYTAKIVIPNYKQRVSEHYRELIHGDLDNYCLQVGMPKVFNHFGLELKFETPAQLHLHNKDMQMIEGLHHIISVLGSLIIKNAYLDSEHRSMGHRNRFPQLNFHVDRSENQPTHYSMYTRNPFDEEQKNPRTSSTLFVASVVAHLQARKEGQLDAKNQKGNQGSYLILQDGVINELLNNIILEHAWNEPMNTGEISILDNLTCLHASYYPRINEKGYKIGVRYIG